MTPQRLVILPEAYPHPVAQEATFLTPELPYLRRVFAAVEIAPQRRGGVPQALPPGISVRDDLAQALAACGRGAAVRALASRGMAAEWRDSAYPRWHPRAAWRAARRIAVAQVIAAWLEQRAATAVAAGEHLVGYAYWLDAAALALAWARRRAPGLVAAVARAHRHDLYRDCQRQPYCPGQAACLRGLDRIYPIAAHGRQTLISYGGDPARLHVARLGVEDPGFRCRASTDGVLRVVSCSAAVAVKRLDRIVAGLAGLAAQHPEQRVEWTHLGDGPTRVASAAAAAALPATVRVQWRGQVEPPAVLAHYREHAVDVLVNLSDSEGIPVAVMEALACGIPVVARAVGGLGEIVSPACGVLLPADPPPSAVAAALLACREGGEALRAGARAVWAAGFAARVNHAAFAADLHALAAGDGVPATVGEHGGHDR
jgi:colanic acid/amylovoran biosynthesis glycosyltransferase